MKFVRIAAICWLIFLGLVGLHQAVALFVSAHGWKGLSPSDWAAWVQAFGSIGALGVAIFVMSRQNAHSAKLLVQAELLAARRRAETVLVMVESAHHQITACLHDLEKALQANDLPTYNGCLIATKVVMTEVRGRLASIPMHDLGSMHLAEGVIRLHECAGIVAELGDMWVGSKDIQHAMRLIAPLKQKADEGITAFRKGVITLQTAIV